MIRLLVWGILLYIGYRLVAKLLVPGQPQVKENRRGEGAKTTHRDPICGVYVAEEDAIIGNHAGQRHYFCSMDCLEKYREQLDHTKP